MTQPIIHIGGAKCASTYMQTGFLSRVEGYQLFSTGSKKADSVLDYCLGVKDKIPAIMNGEIISHEGISVPYSKNRSKISKKIKKIAPKARILYVIRNQVDWLNSRYSQDLKKYMGVYTRYYKFHEWISGEFHEDLEAKTGRPSSLYKPMHRIKYENIACQYKDIYDDVVVVPMEYLYEKKFEQVLVNKLQIELLNKSKDSYLRKNKRRGYITEEIEKAIRFLPQNKRFANYFDSLFPKKKEGLLKKYLKASK